MVTHRKHVGTILAIDDDPDVRSTVMRTLTREGYTVVEAHSGMEGLNVAQECRPDVIIIDIMLGDMSGLELCTRLRKMPFVNHTPILFLSVHQSAQHVARALDCGGDDYLRKPFVPRELSARVRALCRRSQSIQNGNPNKLRLEPSQHTVVLNTRRITLTPTEFSLVEFLCRNQGRHHTASSLLEKLWQYPPGDGDTALVRNHIRNLRRKIEHDPDHPAIIVSLHGRGYTINAEVV